MLTGMLFLGLFLMTLLYAIRTLRRMRHRILYPLIRYRQTDGTTRAASMVAAPGEPLITRQGGAA
jgi:hypothetical protein